jgi:choline dehydrogenase
VIAGAVIPPGSWDDVIVGSGSAGAVLASRLSECPDRRVLLLEAGAAATRPEPRAPLGTPVLTGANWSFDAWVGDVAGTGRRVPYPVGKVVGGSSAVNGGIALRGLPGDFDGWSAAGNPAWSWERVRPYFERLEDDPRQPDPGRPGRALIPLWRPALENLDPLGEAFLRACRSAGLPYVPDLNSSPAPGVGLVPSTARQGRHVSAADAYLTPVLDRPNLVLCPGWEVSRVLTAGRRAIGVEASHGSRALVRVPAGRVTLSAGAISTPAILQRSGIGEAGRIGALGLDVVADLPGVGKNLTDHPVVAIWARPRPGACRMGQPVHTVMARTASDGEGVDLGFFLAGSSSGHGLPVISQMLGGQPGASVSAVLLDPASRGSVHLPAGAPAGRPEIVLRLASHRRDMDRLMTAARTAWSLIRSTQLAGQLERVFVWTDRMMGEDALLSAAVSRFVAPLWHPAGTARMGPVTDTMAVVDDHCQVHAMTGLTVVDASVMPVIPRATPNLSCLMLAERVAEWMA